jgi:hypothetical protein
MNNVNVQLMISVYNECKEVRIFLNINTNRNEMSLCKHENFNGKPVFDYIFMLT